jgi:TorA maturation chaperone TorD
MDMANDAELNPQELAGAAKARAAFYAFLSVHFTTLPDAPFVERMRSGDFTTMLEALVKDDSVEPDIATGASLMRAYLDNTLGDEVAQLAEKLGVDRTRLYRGITPEYGPPPPYQTVWTRSRAGQDVDILQTLAGLYREMGLAPSPEATERLDYIGVELDFLRELALREAAAWESDKPETAATWVAAQQAFMNEHLGEWAPAFIEKALEWAKTDFYRGHLLMLRGFITGELRDLNLPGETQ